MTEYIFSLLDENTCLLITLSITASINNSLATNYENHLDYTTTNGH